MGGVSIVSMAFLALARPSFFLSFYLISRNCCGNTTKMHVITNIMSHSLRAGKRLDQIELPKFSSHLVETPVSQMQNSFGAS
jgi:hypothetical protein